MTVTYETTGFYRVRLIPNKRVYIEKAYLLSNPNAKIKLSYEQLRETSMYNPQDLSFYLIVSSADYWTPGKPIVKEAAEDYWFETTKYDAIIIPMYFKTEEYSRQYFGRNADKYKYVFVGKQVYTFSSPEKILGFSQDSTARSANHEIKLNTRKASKRVDKGFISLRTGQSRTQ